MIGVLMAWAMSWSSPTTCDSTIFGYAGDGYGGRTPTVLTGKPVTESDFGIAHRTWKMGTVIMIQNQRTKKTGVGVVLDRGPYGMVDPMGWFNSRRERGRAAKYILEVGKRKAYRGCADITPSLAERIGHNGRDRVKIWRAKR